MNKPRPGREKSSPGRCFLLLDCGAAGILTLGEAKLRTERKTVSPQAIQTRPLQHPFQPFRICLSDGSTYEVRQAEMGRAGA